MTLEQIKAIKCAYLDLSGSYGAFISENYYDHDWQSHKFSMDMLEEEFPFLLDEKDPPVSHPKVQKIIYTLAEEVNADGETMEYILRELNLAHQVYKQLSTDENITKTLDNSK